MKVVIDKVQNGLVPYGPGVGSQALAIYFKEVEGEFDYKAPTPKEGEEPKEYTPEEIIKKGLIDDITNSIHNAELDVDFAKSFFGVKSMYFIGDCVADPKYRDIFKEIVNFFYLTSFQIQKTEIEKQGIAEDKAKELIRRFSICLVTSPLYYTAKENFYRLFDFIVVKMPFDNSADSGAIAELENTSGVLEVLTFTNDFEKEKAKIDEIYKSKNALSMPEKIFVVDASTKIGDAVATYALKNGYTVEKATGYNSDIQLEF